MLLQQLVEAVENKKHTAFSFGRMNPPTVGHKKLLDTVKKVSNGGDYHIFTGQSQDPKKNPLNYDSKVKFIAGVYPEHVNNIVADREVKTIMDAASKLYDEGYREVTFVAGEDRLADFKQLLTQYNGKEGFKSYYNFDNMNFISSGKREDGAEGVEGVSASGARRAAEEGNFKAFEKATGAGELAPQLYKEVRKGMNVTEAAGVGVVAHNKKMAKDPRYSMSMTVDVGPNTASDNMNALGLGRRPKWLMKSYDKKK